jgi:hypothetical protein
VNGRRRLATAALSAAAHAGLLFLIIQAQPEGPGLAEPQPIVVTLVQPPSPPPEPPASEETPKPKPEPAAKPPPPRKLPVRPPKAPPPPSVRPLQVAAGPQAKGEDEVSEAELASAGTADNGAGGRQCNMIRRLQAALRRDPLVQSAVAEAHRGRAIRVWNGDWIRHGEEEGAGLAAVREAIMWEVGFAPEACRDQPVSGPIVLSLNDGPGAARLVVGGGDWRWKDLLSRRR